MKHDCWPWVGRKHPKGYGVVSRDGVDVYAHRLVYEEAHGPIPNGGVVHHTCENKGCVNPRHLQLLGGNAEHRAIHRKERCSRGHLKRRLPSGQWTCPTCSVERVRKLRTARREAMAYQA